VTVNQKTLVSGNIYKTVTIIQQFCYFFTLYFEKNRHFH